MSFCPPLQSVSWSLSQDKSKASMVPRPLASDWLPWVYIWSSPGEWDLEEFCWGALGKSVLPNKKEYTGRKSLFFAKHGLAGKRCPALPQLFYLWGMDGWHVGHGRLVQCQAPGSLVTRLPHWINHKRMLLLGSKIWDKVWSHFSEFSINKLKVYLMQSNTLNL